jgi:hypothetical protein
MADNENGAQEATEEKSPYEAPTSDVSGEYRPPLGCYLALAAFLLLTPLWFLAAPIMLGLLLAAFIAFISMSILRYFFPKWNPWTVFLVLWGVYSILVWGSFIWLNVAEAPRRI